MPKKTPAKRGRPCRYTKALAEEICARLSEGESLRSICRDDHMPPASTVRGWVVEDIDGFAEQYARARDVGLDAMAEEVIEIADGDARDVQRDRLRFDARRWYLSKLAPKRYGEKPAEERDDDVPSPVKVEVAVVDARKDADA